MALSNSESLNFGLAAIRLRRNNLLIFQDSLVGNVQMTWNTGTNNTMPAASNFAAYYRNTSSEGGGTISLLDRPLAVDADITGGTVTKEAASSTPVVSTISNTNGTSIASDITVSATAATNHYDFLVEATASAVLNVSWIGPRGEQNEASVAISDTATLIGDTGVSITGSSSPNYTVGDRAEFDVQGPHGGTSEVAIPQIKTSSYYELTVWGAEGGADDSPERIIVPRIYVVGADYAKTAKEMPAVELAFNICAPLDGGSIVRRKVWQPAS